MKKLIAALAVLMFMGNVFAQSQAEQTSPSGGRARADIMRVVRQNMPSLQFAYNQRLRDIPDLRGEVIVRWSIDEFGNVVNAQLQSSTVGDETLAQTIVSRIMSWKFGRVNIPGDITEVSYPFIFSPGN